MYSEQIGHSSSFMSPWSKSFGGWPMLLDGFTCSYVSCDKIKRIYYTLETSTFFKIEISRKSFKYTSRPYYGPEIYSTTNRNEYQKSSSV
jgi:hypothetical protein